jgi:hypothetical protein
MKTIIKEMGLQVFFEDMNVTASWPASESPLAKLSLQLRYDTMPF